MTVLLPALFVPVPADPVLADGEGIGAAITILIIVVGWIANLVSNKSQKGPPVASRPRPPARTRDERLQQEISIFIEDAGGQRSRQTARPGLPAAGSRNPPAAKRAPAPAKKTARCPRPGEEIATRHAPVTEALGTGVKQHLSQHMTERVAQEVQQRLAPRVEEKVAEDLGPPVTTGASRPTTAPQGVPSVPRPERLAEILRSRTGLQQTIALNLILSPPVSRTRSSRR
jgi:hypothetical protein